MSEPKPALRFLHLHSSFDAGGKELRCVRLINAFGLGIEHAIVSAEPAALAAGELISYEIPTDYPPDFPSLKGFPWFGRLARIALWMKEFDLVLTYNWGAMDGVMAHTLYAQMMQLPPLVHHEDGFNEDEAVRLNPRRNWYRRFALDRADALVVPSQRLEEIALRTWRQPRAKVHRIANGIDTRAFAKKPKPDVLPGLIKHTGERWVGTLAGLRAVKNLPRLARAFAGLPDEWQLVILGEGPERDAIEREARLQRIEHRVHLPGFVEQPETVVGLFDIFALSSDSEQFPVSVLQGMAAGLPVAAPAVGDIADMVAAENAPFVVPPGDEPALAAALARLAAEPRVRATVGAANRAKARAQFDERAMIARYGALYAAAMGREALP